MFVKKLPEFYALYVDNLKQKNIRNTLHYVFYSIFVFNIFLTIMFYFRLKPH